MGISGGMRPGRRSRAGRNHSPASEGDDEHVPRGLLRTVERLFERFAAALPNPRTDYTVERARRHGAYTFSSAPTESVAGDWITRMERVFESLGCPATRRVPLAIDLLDGDAWLWWQGTRNMGFDPTTMTWEEFKTEFSNRYYNQASQHRLRFEFMQLKQTEEMTVLQYEERFIAFSRFAPELVATEKLKVDQFINGLLPVYRDWLAPHDYPTFKLAVEAAMRCEARYLDGSRPLEIGGPSQGPSKRIAFSSGSASSSSSRPSSSDSSSRQRFRGRFRRPGQTGRRQSRGGTASSSGGFGRQAIPRDYPQCATCGRHHAVCQAGTALSRVVDREGVQ
ncbi:uncharacterized protein LOC121052325 [Rosa chinensis]|uniref:uncharacterized protein LOC121052325 n=1 Tax=Rosa chinensis TaxID=74649 RepID=UPI001AD90984|nr:uncharacterized protein LOC121052325 [Rosa chinensis]